MEKEYEVAKFSDLKSGEMKGIDAGGTKVLLARIGDDFHAVGATCPHYGAPLDEGVVSGKRIICPWHHACFDVTTGDLEEPPSFDALPCFKVTIRDEMVYVTVPENPVDRRIPQMARRDFKDERTFVILGGGAAGFMAAQTLREDGFQGRVLMITREDRLPYDRPNLSKDYLQGHAEPQWMPLRGEDFFDKHDIEIKSGKEVVKIDKVEKTCFLKDGEGLEYDSILIATGGSPRTLPFQYDQQKNVYLLRSFEDSDAIIAAAEKGKKAVVIGASFIGMEAASSLKTRGCDVTVVASDKVPFEKTLGGEIGNFFQDIHEQHFVNFRVGSAISQFEGEKYVTAVVLENGERLECDFVVVGIGVTPDVKFLEGIELHDDGGVIADKYLRIADDIFAAGDITHYPDRYTNELTRIEHWRMAMQQGRTAAHNMAGKKTIFDAVPFFWTTQFDATLNYVGHAKDWDTILIHGSVKNRDFLAGYVKENKLLAIAGMNRDKEIASYEEVFRSDKQPGSEVFYKSRRYK
ncbi:MAG: FAD-dependent oxidoreductase [Pyrinomonadaceae bacterium]